MSYSRRLKELLSLLYAAVERDWLREYSIHVDGSASGNSPTTGYLRTAKRLAAYMEVGGTLRTYFGAPNAALAAAIAERPIAPGRSRVLCPPGTYAFRGLFLFMGWRLEARSERKAEG